MSFWWKQIEPSVLAEIDLIDATAELRANSGAIPFETQKACVVHGPFIPCTDDCPRVPATYTMKRDGKRGARLARREDGVMVMPFNLGTPHFGCLGTSFHPACKHEQTEKLVGHDDKAERYCVACGTRVI